MAVFLVLIILVHLALAQPPQDPIKNFCRRYGHQTAVIDRKLIIDGGWQYANPLLDNPQPTINQGLLYGDLDRLNKGDFPTVYSNLTKNNSVPSVAGGILWADQVNKVAWLYGGEYSSAPSTFQLWGYDVVLNQWNLSTAASESSASVRRAAYGAGTTISELGRGYYYGGYLNSLTTPLWSGSQYATNSLIVYDMDRNILTNKSGPYDGYGRAEGAMVSIPASTSGMLVYFGGSQYLNRSAFPTPQPMDTILLYDIGDEKWYTQKATGDIPGNRRKFCAGAAWANDKSSYNIYLYGGLGYGENSTGYDDVYILTLPSFQWIKWYPEPGASLRPHGILSCDVIDNSQMIVMGGNFTLDNDCDVPELMGMHNLNLGQNNPKNEKWYAFMSKSPSYVVPPAIVSAIGGSPTGGATRMTPLSGFTDPALRVYFNGKANYQARTPTRSLPSATGKPGSGGSGVNIGLIVGAAAGGVVVLIAIGLAIFYCRRHKSKKAKRAGKPPSPPPIRTELPAFHNEKAVSQVVSSPSSSHSPIPTYSSTQMAPPLSPGYQYQHVYPQHDPAYQQYYSQLHTQQPYPPHHVYGYNQYPPGVSPPEGWTHYPTQQYFPPPDSRRMSPPLQEMPTVMSPGPNSTPKVVHNDNVRLYHPSPTNSSGPVRRRDLGSASSPTTETVTSYSDTASRV